MSEAAAGKLEALELVFCQRVGSICANQEGFLRKLPAREITTRIPCRMRMRKSKRMRREEKEEGRKLQDL